MFSQKHHHIIVGDYTYYDDFEDALNFEKNVKYHYDFLGDKLIIGKFCMIAPGVTFIMNGNGWERVMPTLADLPMRGDTVIGNDVWMGSSVTIIPGVNIGDGLLLLLIQRLRKISLLMQLLGAILQQK